MQPFTVTDCENRVHRTTTDAKQRGAIIGHHFLFRRCEHFRFTVSARIMCHLSCCAGAFVVGGALSNSLRLVSRMLVAVLTPRFVLVRLNRNYVLGLWWCVSLRSCAAPCTIPCTMIGRTFFCRRVSTRRRSVPRLYTSKLRQIQEPEARLSVQGIPICVSSTAFSLSVSRRHQYRGWRAQRVDKSRMSRRTACQQDLLKRE